jgi:hypothetical protein
VANLLPQINFVPIRVFQTYKVSRIAPNDAALYGARGRRADPGIRIRIATDQISLTAVLIAAFDSKVFNEDQPVGSRTGAVFRRSGLACCSPFPLGVPQYPNRESVSSPRHIAPSVRISRTRRTCLLCAKSYVAYRAGAAFTTDHRRSR